MSVDSHIPNPVAINFCNADYSVRHLNNENDETTKHVQTLKRPPFGRGLNTINRMNFNKGFLMPRALSMMYVGC